ncbi:MAG TPA: alpha/beta hydrolase [Gemmatimonadaceae bacterium]|jgi:pimeloyl-ACP methyl ester carboxylesterase|nr:alpha/beta hydrolase [Gemmatimonadaceae bacterium]
MSPRFLPETEIYPAGIEATSARYVGLPSGIRVRVVESGSEEGEAVVMLPGWGCSAYAFRKNIGALAERGARVVAVELKGQGGSDKPLGEREYSVESLTRHTIEVLDALGIEKATLVGLSLGGLIAAHVALQEPERVKRLALLDPVGFGRVRLVGLAQLFPTAMGAMLPRIAGRWAFGLALHCAYGSLGKPTARDVDEYFAPARDPAFVQTLWAQLHEVDWRLLTADELSRLTMPLLVIFGCKDRLVSPRNAERLVREAPDGRAIFIEGAGHASPEEAPDEVNAALVEFIG